MNNNFQLYSKYYDLLYKDKDYHKEAQYVISQIVKYNPNAKVILEYGSGTGGHGLEMQKSGFTIFGLERSIEMVDIARKNGLPCCQADITNFNLNSKYDAVIALFHVISYLTNNIDLIGAFRNAYRHLRKNGLFLFDVWYSPAVYEQKALPRIKKLKNEELMVTRIAEPINDINKNIVDVRYTMVVKDIQSGEISEFSESHPMRHFSIPEIELLAKYTKFKFIQAEEFLSGNEPSDKTWGVCFILKKE